jgi:hypothetical protein
VSLPPFALKKSRIQREQFVLSFLHLATHENIT